MLVKVAVKDAVMVMNVVVMMMLACCVGLNPPLPFAGLYAVAVSIHSPVLCLFLFPLPFHWTDGVPT